MHAATSLADGDAAEGVARNRERPGKHMVIFTGATFAETALRTDVVDAIWLLTIPELYSHGARLFEGDGLRRTLRLSEARAMDTGAAVTRHEVVRQAK
jgi:dihydrofolate reductase